MDAVHRRRRTATRRYDRATRSACTRRTTGCSGSTPTCSRNASETRRQRRMVISFFTTIGNYDYGFYWYLYLDGTIELRGQGDRRRRSPRRTRRRHPYATQVAPGLGAPYHQHLFSRPAGHDRRRSGQRRRGGRGRRACRWGRTTRAATPSPQPRTRLTRESEAQRIGRPGVGRGPGTSSTRRRRNRCGRARRVRAAARGRVPTLLADEDCSIHRPGGLRDEAPVGHRATTRRSATPAGDFVNQHPGGAGLPGVDVAADRPRVDGRRRRRLAHVRPDALPAPGGLADHARRLHRLPAEAGRASSTATRPSTSRRMPAPTATPEGPAETRRGTPPATGDLAVGRD